MTSGVAAFSSYLGPWKDEPDQTVHTIAEHSAGDRSLSITLLHSFRTTVSHRCTRRHLQFTVTYDKPACIADIQQAVLALQSLLTTLSREPLSVGSVMVNTEAGGFEYYNTSWSHLSNTERPKHTRISRNYRRSVSEDLAESPKRPPDPRSSLAPQELVQSHSQIS